MAVDSLEDCGIYFGTTGGQVYASADAGRQLGADRPRPARRAVGRGPDAAMIRVVLPAHLRTLARVDGEVELDVAGQVTQRAVLDALEAGYPMLRGTIRDHGPGSAGRSSGSSRCEQDLSHEPPRRAAAGRGGQRRGAVPDRRGDGRRLAAGGQPDRWSPKKPNTLAQPSIAASGRYIGAW